MIEAMVSGLAERLKDQPDDVEGWLKLIRSYVVLGRADDAAEAARDALQGVQAPAATQPRRSTDRRSPPDAAGGAHAMTRKKRRLALIAAAGAVLALAAALVLFALRDQIVFFYSPTEVAEKAPAPGTRVRLGGLVAEGSVERADDGSVSFVVTDTAKTVQVVYRGILPDLFREGQGVVAEGCSTAGGGLAADNVLAKHDENYMPRRSPTR